MDDMIRKQELVSLDARASPEMGGNSGHREEFDSKLEGGIDFAAT